MTVSLDYNININYFTDSGQEYWSFQFIPADPQLEFYAIQKSAPVYETIQVFPNDPEQPNIDGVWSYHSFESFLSQKQATHAASLITKMNNTDSPIIWTLGNFIQFKTNLQAVLDNSLNSQDADGIYAPLVHSHSISNISGLQSILDAKAASSSLATVATSGSYNDLTNKPSFSLPIAISDVSGLQTALDGKSATSHTHSNVTTSVAGFMSASDKSKLDGIAAGATVNDTDSNLKNRANHTGTQTVSTLSDFTSAVDARIQNVVGAAPTALDTLVELATALGNDANFASTVTTALAAKVATSVTVNGHALSSNVTVTKSDVGLGNCDNTSDANKPVSSATQTALNAKQNTITTGSTAQYFRGDLSLATFPLIPSVYFGSTLRNDAIIFTKSIAVASGVAVFYLTTDGTSSGTAIFPNGPNDDSLNLYVNDATASYQMSHAWSNSNKTLTITVNKLTTANILTGILGQAAAPNGTLIRLTIMGR